MSSNSTQPPSANTLAAGGDAAEFVSQSVPEIIAPTGQVVVSATFRNVGTTTWTPELGYKLGSENPQGNTTWGTNRALMNAASQIRPGQICTFAWVVKAPQTPGVYNFQWRMLREGVQWFGPPTPNRYIHVKARPDGGSRLKRNTATGLLQESTGVIITLRGGHYHLFEINSQADRKLVYHANYQGHLKGETILKEYAGVAPCPGALPASDLIQWPNDNWGEFYNALRANDINLIRVFLTNGAGIYNEQADDLYPFKHVTQGGQFKWQIKLAVNAPNNATSWNAAFFARLRAFAQMAAQRFVYLQISLLNYFDLDDNAWDVSIWNPARSDDYNWGLTHLVNTAGYTSCGDGKPLNNAEEKRQCYFIETQSAGLRAVQEQLVRKVVRELAGLPNIIFEVMNEPHRGTQAASAKFASKVVDWIISEGDKQTPQWRPLISVNASRRGIGTSDPDGFDVDWWAVDQLNTPHYEDIDIISFHGLTGYGTNNHTVACGTDAFPRVDRESVESRFNACRAKHPGKAVMMSTDAVRVKIYYHQYGANRMDLMEGQLTTDLMHMGASTAERRTRSDLEDWAYWCFSTGRHSMSVIHFQHHDTFEAIYANINAAFRASLGGGD